MCANTAYGSTILTPDAERFYLTLECEGRQAHTACINDPSVEAAAVATITDQRVTGMLIDTAPGDPEYDKGIADNFPIRLRSAADDGGSYLGAMAEQNEMALHCSPPDLSQPTSTDSGPPA